MASNTIPPIRILFADDDRDDRYFFEMALKSLPFDTELTTVEDGEKLMKYLHANSDDLPHVLFLDHNMPRKNGSECLAEIKLDPVLRKIPVIMYSTSIHSEVADVFYQAGAHLCIRKTDLAELKNMLNQVLDRIQKNKFARPSREQFILTPLAV